MNAENAQPLTPQDVAIALSRDLPELSEGIWSETPAATAPTATVGQVLALLDGEEREGPWVGLAETTTGSRALRRATAEALTDTAGESVPLDTVYELRLWRPLDHAESGLLAHELRWINGAGSAEIRVETAPAGQGPSGAVGEPCWWRHNAYLQHHSAERTGSAPTMTSLEVFTQESEYGNTVFADELLTGKWG